MDKDKEAGSAECICPSCGERYDARDADFCDCVTSIATPRCPYCLKCLCKLPKERQQEFWESAPPVLWKKKMELRRDATTSEDGPATPELSRPLVVLAEDDAVTRRVAQRVLEKLGYCVITAERGDEALALTRLHKPDILLSDALMPKLDGRELCLILKNDPETSGIKVIIMTSLFTKSQSKSEALQEYKADAFLRKPIDLNELREVIDGLLWKGSESG